MRLVVSLPDVTYTPLTVDFTVVILTPVCDCTLLEWTAPVPETFSTTVKKIPSDVFTISKSTVTEVSKDASPKIRACYIDGGPSCSESTVITTMVENGSTFPTYMSRAGDDVTVNSDDNDQARTYVMDVTHSTINNGNLQYATVTINIGWCVITDIAAPDAPEVSATSYIIFDTQLTITLTPQFAQVPACGYALVEDI